MPATITSVQQKFLLVNWVRSNYGHLKSAAKALMEGRNHNG